MLRALAVPGLLLFFMLFGLAQIERKEGTPAEFEVAAIKPFAPPQPQGGKQSPGRRGGAADQGPTIRVRSPGMALR